MASEYNTTFEKKEQKASSADCYLFSCWSLVQLQDCIKGLC